MIGTLRPEEAIVSDSEKGFHQFTNMYGESYGSFEVFWHGGGIVVDGGAEGQELEPGWYWHACSPGCLPDGDASGPFASSRRARCSADEYWKEG